jgi:hypothetical protein
MKKDPDLFVRCTDPGDPDPDPHQNATDPQRCLPVKMTLFTYKRCAKATENGTWLIRKVRAILAATTHLNIFVQKY